METTKVEIKTKTILMVFGILGLIYLAFLLRNIIVIFIFAYIIYSGLKPIVDKLEDIKIPRTVSVFLIYISILIIFGLLIFFTIDTLISQIEFFAKEFPDFVKSIVERINTRFPESKDILDSRKIGSDLRDLLKEYTNLSDLTSGNIASTALNAINALSVGGFTIVNSVFGGFLSVFATIMSSAYMLNRRGNFLEGVIDIFPEKYHQSSKSLLNRVQGALSEWVSGQFVLMLTISIFSYIAIMIPYVIGVDNYVIYRFAFLLALIAGVMEAFPGVGPTITLIIATILTIGSGAPLVIILYVILSFILIQQMEGFFIVPNVMKRVVNVDPVVSILGIIGGVQLIGILGAILSIPVIATIQIVIFEIKGRMEKQEKNIKTPKQQRNFKIKLPHLIKK